MFDTKAKAGGLSSFLLGDGQADDSLFASSKGASRAFEAKPKPSTSRTTSTSSTAPRPSTSRYIPQMSIPSDDESSSESEDDDLPEGDREQLLAVKRAKAFSKQLKAAVAGKPVKRKAKEIEPESSSEEESEESEDESDEEEDLVHESVESPKRKRTPEEEQERNRRTIFVGNVPSVCATSRPSKKALIRHLLDSDAVKGALPKGVTVKCESIRFRSLAFSSTIFGRSEKDVNSTADVSHAKKRARMWKDAATPEEALVIKKGMSDKQKRRAAAIKQELNENKKNCNAYLVLQVKPVESVNEAMQAVISATHNSVFEGFTLRVDRASGTGADAKAEKGLTKEEAKRTIFIGGLDFAETEENVRAAVQAALSNHLSDTDTTFVDDVRIVRDQATGLGKGFAYVRFADELSVDHMLALPSDKPLKISKRKVRLERCKTRSAALRAKSKAAAATSEKKAKAGQDASKNNKKRREVDPAAMAALKEKKGPSKRQEELASKLSALDKDERKKAKALDSERVARRMAKKQAKVLQAHAAQNAGVAAGDGDAGEKPGKMLGRESRREKRNRQEKKRVTGINSVKTKTKAKKGGK